MLRTQSATNCRSLGTKRSQPVTTISRGSGTKDAPSGLHTCSWRSTCLRKQLWNERRKISAKARLRAHRQASLCAKRSNTFAKENTERDRPNRQSRSACQRHAARVSTCLHLRKVQLPNELDGVQRAPARRVAPTMTKFRRRDRARRGVPSRMKVVQPLQRRRSRGMRTRRPLRRRHLNDRPPLVKR